MKNQDALPVYKKYQLELPLSLPRDFAIHCLNKVEEKKLNDKWSEFSKGRYEDLKISFGGNIDADGNVEAYMHCSGFDGIMHFAGKQLEVKMVDKELFNKVLEYSRREYVEMQFQEEEQNRQKKRKDEIYQQLFG